MISQVFNRVEKKYLIPNQKYKTLIKTLSIYMTPDEHGLSTICNIYFDSEKDTLIRASLDKPSYKEKLRLRSYGIPSAETKVFLEIKKKYQGIVNKRRVSLSLKEAEDYFNDGIVPHKNSQIMKEINYFLHYYQVRPALFIAYDRIAYFGNEDHNFRVTFDENIRSRRDDLSLSSGAYGVSLLEEEEHLMEVKVMGAMPLWFAALLSDLQLFPTTFSKYGEIYQKEIIQKRRKYDV